MTTANTVEKYLQDKAVAYDVVPHEHTSSSLQSARSAHVPPEQLAKAVLLEDGEHFLMAVLPSACHLNLADLRRQLGREVGMAAEDEIKDIFNDCALGAVPALGPAYGLETVYEDSLARQPEIFFEAGDHENLVHMQTSDYLSILRGCGHGNFCEPL